MEFTKHGAVDVTNFESDAHHNRGCHSTSEKQISQKLEKLQRQKGSQWQPVVREGAMTALLVRGVCRFKPRGSIYLCTKSGPNHMQYTNLTK